VKPRLWAFEGVDAVEEKHVKVNVEVQRRAEALDEGDRPGLGAGGDGESGLLDEVCGDGAVHHAQDLAQDLRLGGEQEAQRVGEGQPHRRWGTHMTDGLFRKDVIDQMGGALYHLPGATRGADKIAGSDFEQPKAGP